MKRSIAVVVLGLLAVCWPVVPAHASWASPASGSALARAATIAAPTNLSASCNLLLDASVSLSWTPSASPWADGYEILQWKTGTSPSSIMVAGRNTASYSTPALTSGTWNFVVRATKGNWRSADAGPVSKSITSVLLGLVCS